MLKLYFESSVLFLDKQNDVFSRDSNVPCSSLENAGHGLLDEVGTYPG